MIVIGSGAGGGTLVHELAPSGKRILLLERGDWLPREPQNWLAQDVFVDNRYVSPDTWSYADGEAFQPQVHYCVGGATKLYGAALYRLRAEDFGELRHHDGISPAWPIGYDEMEPYYTRAEQLYRSTAPTARTRRTRPRARPYPFPAVSHEPRIQQLSDDLAAAGLHPFHAPCGVHAREDDPPHSPCVRCQNCDGFPCLVHAKSDAEVARRPPRARAPQRRRCSPTPRRCARDRPGGDHRHRRRGRARRRARDAHGGRRRRVLRGGQQREAAARLGLRGAPRGAGQRLRPGRPQLHVPQQPGRSGAVARSPTRRCSRRRSESTTSTSRRDEIEYPLGQHPDGRQVPGADVPRREAGRDAIRAGVDAARRREPRRGLLALDGGPPTAGNRVTLGRDGSITLRYTASNEVPKKRLYRELKSMLGHLGMHHDHLLGAPRLPQERDPGGRRRPPGGDVPLRRPTRPRPCSTRDCRAHEVDNLYVVDTSFFPSIGAVNPALTAMANALRVGDHLLRAVGREAARRESAHAA